MEKFWEKPSEETIINAVRTRHPRDRTFKISRTIPNFLGGELALVDVVKDNQVIGENYVYAGTFFRPTLGFLSLDELANWVTKDVRNDIRPRSNSTSIFSRLASIDIVPSIIAIIVTITICSIVFFNIYIQSSSIEIPDILSNALTMILGFYFGSQAHKFARGTHESPPQHPSATDAEMP